FHRRIRRRAIGKQPHLIAAYQRRAADCGLHLQVPLQEIPRILPGLQLPDNGLAFAVASLAVLIGQTDLLALLCNLARGGHRRAMCQQQAGGSGGRPPRRHGASTRMRLSRPRSPSQRDTAASISRRVTSWATLPCSSATPCRTSTLTSAASR